MDAARFSSFRSIAVPTSMIRTGGRALRGGDQLPSVSTFMTISISSSTPPIFQNRSPASRTISAPRRAGRFPAADQFGRRHQLPLITAKERGAGGGISAFNMAKESIASHISQFPWHYKKAHHHGTRRHVIVLSRRVFADVAAGEEPRRYDWRYGALIVRPMLFHQISIPAEPARYLAFSCLAPQQPGVPMSWISKRLGGNQIDYADEKPAVRQISRTRWPGMGLTPRMDRPISRASSCPEVHDRHERSRLRPDPRTV